MVARLEFDDARFLGASLTEAPDQVLTALQARDTAWHHALTFTEYVASQAV